MRRLSALLKGLPPDSAVARSYDPERLGAGWGYEQELLAVLAELVDQTNRLIFAVNSKKGTRLPNPIFIPRPGRVLQKRNATADEIAALMGERGVMVRGTKREEQ